MDLPGLRLSYSRSSRLAQKYYFATVLAEIGFTISIAALAFGIVVFPSSTELNVGLILVALLFILSAGVRLLTSVAHIDQRWYEYRAAAESMKTVSWLYAMRAGEFSLEDGVADHALRARLRRIGDSSKSKPFPWTVPRDVDASIPASMKGLRGKEWEARRAIYLTDRIEDQRTWYQATARRKSLVGWAFSILVLGIQVIGVVIALVLLSGPHDPALGVSGIALLAVLISSVIAWTQAKQYSELVEPYLMAFGELVQLREEVEGAQSEQVFVELVAETELAISREHVSWLAKRGVRNPSGA